MWETCIVSDNQPFLLLVEVVVHWVHFVGTVEIIYLNRCPSVMQWTWANAKASNTLITSSKDRYSQQEEGTACFDWSLLSLPGTPNFCAAFVGTLAQREHRLSGVNLKISRVVQGTVDFHHLLWTFCRFSFTLEVHYTLDQLVVFVK